MQDCMYRMSMVVDGQLDTCFASHIDGQVCSAASSFFSLFPEPRDAEDTSFLHEAQFAVQLDAERVEPQMS